MHEFSEDFPNRPKNSRNLRVICSPQLYSNQISFDEIKMFHKTWGAFEKPLLHALCMKKNPNYGSGEFLD